MLPCWDFMFVKQLNKTQLKMAQTAYQLYVSLPFAPHTLSMKQFVVQLKKWCKYLTNRNQFITNACQFTIHTTCM